MTLIDDLTYTLTGDVHNFRILRSALSERVRFDPNGGDRTISGLLVTDPTSTRLLIVKNISETNTIEFLEEDSGSEEKNQFSFTTILGAGKSVLLFYEPADRRWQLIVGEVGDSGVEDHGLLTGLLDDDHPQYAYLAGRSGGQVLNGGVAASEDLTLVSTLHATKGDIFIGLFTWPTADGLTGQVLTTDGSGVLSFSTPASGVTDHGLLTGLADDDHTQYARLGGRAGGQILNGGTAASEDLRIISTTNATKGDIFIGPLTWPTADGSANQVMITNGIGQLSFAAATSLFDHGQLSGLADDDHTQYLLAEGSSTDNRIVRWDGTTGRAVQDSVVTIDDSGNASGFVSVAIGTTPATAGSLRGTSSFTLQARNTGNSANVQLVGWASNDVTFGQSGFDTVIVGQTISLNSIFWPAADGTSSQVMITNGAGQLSFVSVTSLFDHGQLGGLADDDHLQYILAEPSSTDNRLVRWDSTTGRAVQTSGVTLSDADAMTGLASAAASNFFSVGGTVANAGNIRGDSGFIVRARDVGNTTNVSLLAWASDALALGSASYDTDILGLTIDIGPLRWPAADGAANAVMITNGAGVLSLVAVTSLFDHGTLGGLGDDDHTQYMHSEASSTDNRLVRWDGTGGRDVQSSGVTLSDTDAMTGLLSAAASSFYSVGATVATAGAIRGDNSFVVRARDVGNTTNAALLSWASDDLALGSTSYDTDILGLTIDIGPLRWPAADGATNAVMTTNGAGVLSLVAVTSLFDHGTLGGLSDDDHTQYMHSEASSTDNQLVRWDGTGGRDVQSSVGVLSDAGALTGLASVTVSGFLAMGTNPASIGAVRGPSNFTLRARNAANSADYTLIALTSDVVVVGDSGQDVTIQGTGLDVLVPVTDFNGNSISNVDDITLASVDPSIIFNDTTGQRYKFSTTGDDFLFTTLNSSNVVLNEIFRVNRSGSTYTNITFTDSYVSANRSDESGVTTVTMTGTLTNYALSSTTTHLRLDPDGSPRTVTGLTGGTQGRKVYVTNVGTGVGSDEDPITLSNDATSTAANRILTSDGQDFVLAKGATVLLFYDTANSRWRVLNKDGVTKWQWRGYLQTTTATTTQFFSLTVPTYYAYFVNVWMASMRSGLEGGDFESGHAVAHFEGVYKRYDSGSAIPPSDAGSGQDDNDDVRPRTLNKIVELNPGHARLRMLNTSTSINLSVTTAGAFDWRHNWVVEILAVPMDPYV